MIEKQVGKKGPEIPNQRNYDQAYNLALELALEDLGAIGDLKALALKAGAEVKTCQGNTLLLNFINQVYQIDWPELAMRPEPPARDRLLILHYLIQSSQLNAQNLITGRQVSYQELPPGLVYMPVFMKRAIKPVINRFASQPGSLIEAGGKLGGAKADYGDESITFTALPRVPVTFLIWRGDEEFTPTGNILFDESILKYLPAEDVTILSEIIAWKLVKASS